LRSSAQSARCSCCRANRIGRSGASWMQHSVTGIPMYPPALTTNIAAPKPWASWRLASSGDASKHGTTREDGVAPAGQGFSSCLVSPGFRWQHKNNRLRHDLPTDCIFFSAERDGRRTIFVTAGGCRPPLCFASGLQEMVDASNSSSLSRQYADFRRLSRCLLCRRLFDQALSRPLGNRGEGRTSGSLYRANPYWCSAKVSTIVSAQRSACVRSAACRRWNFLRIRTNWWNVRRRSKGLCESFATSASMRSAAPVLVIRSAARGTSTSPNFGPHNSIEPSKHAGPGRFETKKRTHRLGTKLIRCCHLARLLLASARRKTLSIWSITVLLPAANVPSKTTRNATNIMTYQRVESLRTQIKIRPSGGLQHRTRNDARGS